MQRHLARVIHRPEAGRRAVGNRSDRHHVQRARVRAHRRLDGDEGRKQLVDRDDVAGGGAQRHAASAELGLDLPGAEHEQAGRELEQRPRIVLVGLRVTDPLLPGAARVVRFPPDAPSRTSPR